MKKVCLVIGAGRGIGGHVAKRFALAADEKERYHSFLVRRSDPTQLNASIEEIQSLGGMASGKLVDILNPDSIEQLIPSIEQDIGPIDTCVYNIGAQFGFQSLHKTSLKQLELGWKLGVQGLFRLSKALLPFWEERGGGTLLVTSSTAALRGNPGQLSHTSAMGGRRMLCQSLNAELARKNIHVAHIVVDGAVYAPDTLGKMIGTDKLEDLRQKEVLLDPSAIAETFWHVSNQPKACWSFELDLRNSKDTPWWNSRL